MQFICNWTWGGGGREQDIKKSLSERHAKVRPQPQKRQIYLKTKNLNSWSCPQAYCGGGCRRKSPLNGPIKNLTPHYNSFVLASFFVLIRKSADVYKLLSLLSLPSLLTLLSLLSLVFLVSLLSLVLQWTVNCYSWSIAMVTVSQSSETKRDNSIQLDS